MKDQTREKIDDTYKWDISRIIHDKSDFDKKYDEVLALCDNLCKYKGTILKDENVLYDFIQKYNDLDNKLTKIYVYAHMLCDTNTRDSKNQQLKLRVDKLNEIVSEKLSFITPEMLSSDFKYIESLIAKNNKLEEERFDLEKTFAYKKHTLSEKEEKIIAKLSNAYGTPSDVQYNYNNADIFLGSIKDENGNKVDLTTSNYIKYMNSEDRNIRINAFTNMYNYYKNIKNTVASAYKGRIKEASCISSVRNYSSALEASLFSDRVNIKTYKSLISKVHDNLKYMYEYLDLKKEMLNLDELHMYDIYVDIIEEKSKDIPYEEGKKIVLSALEKLGNEYTSVLKKAFTDKWIDVYPNIGKKSGAYSWGTYGTDPYLLLNYDNTIDAVSTMAHELGHSMHSYYSTHNQKYTYHNYPIILAEIASTVNEMLLNDYLYKNAKSNNEKAYYLNEFLEKVRTTIYRQTMFAEFEMIMHEKEEKNIPLTEEEFSNTYYDLNKLYYGNQVVSDDLIRYEWMRIPHFFTPFYVYKYATGLSIAIKIAYDIINDKNNMQEKYIKFLKSGCSKYPLDLLKDLDIDLEEGAVIDEALDLFEEKLQELKKVLKSK